MLLRLFALLLVITLLVGTESLHGALPTFRRHRQVTDPSLISSRRTGHTRIVRHYQLYSRCSSGHVQILYRRKAVYGNGTSQNPFTKLVVESDVSGNSRIRIQGKKTRKYLCFSRRAKLILRSHGDNAQCVFVEEIDKRKYTRIRSAANPHWYVGFRKNGRALRGHHISKRRKPNCFQFIKRPAKRNRLRVRPKHRHKWGPKLDFSQISRILSRRRGTT